MINLMPPGMRAELRAAKMNTVLRKYALTATATLGVIVMIFGGALYVNQKYFEEYSGHLEQSKQKLASLQNLRKRVKAYNDSLAQAKNIFSKEIRLSRLIKNLSSTLPPGAVLNTVSFNVDSLDEPIMVTAQLDSFEKAAILKRNFEDSGLFKTVTLSEVSSSATTGGSDSGEEEVVYPFTAGLEVSLTPEAANAAKTSPKSSTKEQP